MIKDLSWRCDFCNQERPDVMIGVCTYLLTNLPYAERNLKYCVDNPLCALAAQEKANTGKL